MPDPHVDLLIQKLRPDAVLPARGTAASTGFDLYACLDAPLTLRPVPQLVPTGIAIEAPVGFDAQVRPRSGLSLKGVGVAFGTIDADYRGEVLVTMWTFGALESYEIHHGDRIAQLVVTTLPAVSLREVEALSNTSRGQGGHGSTGR
jgi:dUTP pyrophosphatase